MTAPDLAALRERADRFDRRLSRLGTSPDRHETLIDLLADAMHWCDFFGEDFHGCLVTACVHYHAERCGEPLRDRTPS